MDCGVNFQWTQSISASAYQQAPYFVEDYDMSTGSETGNIRSTEPKAAFPSIRQFTVFLENRAGQLLEVLRRFRGTKVRILALNMIDSSECVIVRLVLSDPEEGRETLERAGLAFTESELIAVIVDRKEPLVEICSALLPAEVNLKQTYPLLVQSENGTVIALMVDNIELAKSTLNSGNIRMLNENELLDLT